MEFKTQFDSHDRVLTNSGDPERITYGGSYDELGRIVLKETGRENLYDFIQSHADSVNIHLLLKRYQNGEIDVLSRVQGVYGDFTQFPTTYAEALNRMNECEQVFNSLPIEVRAKFDHNFSQFLAESGNSDFMDKLGIKSVAVPDQLEKPDVIPAVKTESEVV